MKKIAATFLVLITLALITSSSVLAKATRVTPQENTEALKAYGDSGDVSSNMHGFNMEDIRAYWISCRSIGIGCEKEFGVAMKDSVLGAVSNSIAYLYTSPPASTNQFIAHYAQKLKLIQPAYAQGIGFSGLSPILPLWKAFRNIAYAFLILIMVAIGFMVLFRMKIDPRTVISVQNALPRIIMTLFLITFSYAIAGLLVDAMYLLLFISISAINIASPFGQLPNVITQYSGGPISNWWAAAWPFGKAGVDGIVTLIGGATFTGISTLVLTVIGAIGGAAAGFGLPGLIIGGALGAGAGASNALIWIIVSLALLFIFFRIFFMLLAAYIQVIISVIFGPLQIMFGAIPNSDAFGSWLRGLVSNLAVFPITSIMLLIGHLIAVFGSKNLWTPPGLGGNVGETSTGIISFGIVLVIPTIVNSFKELIKAKSVLPVGGAISQSLTSPWSTAMQMASSAYYIQAFVPQSIKERIFGGQGDGGGKAQKPKH